MKFKGFNIEIDEKRIATDQMVYLVKLMKMAKESGKKEMLEKCVHKIEKWFKDWQGELIGEEPAKSELIRKLKGLGK